MVSANDIRDALGNQPPTIPVSFNVPAGLHAEAEQAAAAMGVSVEDLALSAFTGYLAGVRDARRGDWDSL